jgi:site-specific DNA-cytosine methylase
LALLEKTPLIKPRYIALENVPGFCGSQAHSRLRETLAATGYAIKEIVLCPTQLGIPNRRRRFYCVAAREGLAEWPEPSPVRSPWAWREVLDEHAATSLEVANDTIAAYDGAIHVVSPDDPTAISSCFTSSYGRSMTASGSYLKTKHGHRRFSPSEILRLLGFPSDYRLATHSTPLDDWPLVGNSLSVPAVRYVLSCIPELATLRA